MWRLKCIPSTHMPSLIHFVYASAATHEFGIESLTEILRQSRENNERVGLTGILLYSEGSFFQVLEGDPAAIDTLCQKLILDKRHTHLTTIIREPIPRRDFDSWSMGFSHISREDLKGIVGLNDFFEDRSIFSGLNDRRAKKLLAAFAQGRWREKLATPLTPVA